MATMDLEKLRNIKAFPELVKYLRDELDWPIEQADFEELFFEYDPDELGIDSKSAAKIEEIKQLRPMADSQPWGIFFIKFAPKRLPVVALRRILSSLAMKKRANARASELATWQLNDLLFISNYGESTQRQITFAHFSQEEQSADLPTLRVLGWDDADTVLHIDNVHSELQQKLAWPKNEKDIESWRKNWASAFTLGHREVITTSKELAVRLAGLARQIRKRANSILSIETENGPLRKLHQAFRESLIHDLSEDDFADMYAQTIAYGLLSARLANPKGRTANELTVQIPVTNPFLKELMETFLNVGGRKVGAGGGEIDFDELGISEVVVLINNSNMEAIIRDFGDKNPQEDPVIHFYELFLKEYDAKKRMQRGVFYTPRPIVSYIVRSVDELLRTEFGLADGLADTTTWDEMAKRHKNLKIPEGVSPDQDFVQILDPATGTGTFLVEVIDIIHKTLIAKWKVQGHSKEQINALWNEYIPKHLLTRLYGYELLMAPYAIAHLKIGLKLYETGYWFDTNERAHVYLTNALEPAQDFSGRFEFVIPVLAHEATAANTIKGKHQFTVIIGNPPYSSISSNMNIWIRTLVNDYLLVNGVRVEEKSNRNHLQNDYIKYIRLADMICCRSGLSIFAYVTSNSYLDGRTLRGLRWNLLQRYTVLSLTNLYGDSNKRNAEINDENIFEITEGVSVLCALRSGGRRVNKIQYAEIQGSREHKYEILSDDLGRISRQMIQPSPHHFLFRPINESTTSEYQSLGVSLDDLFFVSGAGMKTNRDAFATGEEAETLLERMREFAGTTLSDEEIRSKFNLKDNYQWKMPKARANFRLRPVTPERILRLTYRPFDQRYVYYDKAVVFNPRIQVMSHLASGTNLALITIGQNESLIFNHVFVSKNLVEIKTGTHYGASVVFPLHLEPVATDTHHQLFARSSERCTNFTTLAKPLLKIAEKNRPSCNLTPEQAVFHYIYAIMYSITYRKRYAEQFLSQFPRIPTRLTQNLFGVLVQFGEKLVALHLLESPKVERFITEFIGGQSPKVEKVSWTNDTVWIDKAQTTGFKGVQEDVWNFHIGGYQVCAKWLKDRKGRTLSNEDINHYQKIVVALSETIRLMQEIDQVIEEHGGWPGAFKTT